MASSQVSVTLLPETSRTGERQLVRASDPTVGAFTFTGTTSQRWESPGRVFEHRLENSDRVVADGTTLDASIFSIEAIEAEVDAQFLDPREDRAATQLQALERLRERRVLVTVLTSWRPPAQHYWIRDITAEKSAETGDSLLVSVVLVPLDIVQLELVASQIDGDIELLGTQVIEVDV